VRFDAVRFTPVAPLYPGPVSTLKLANKECGGVRVVLTDREHCAVVDVGVVLALTLQKTLPRRFKVDAMSRLLANDDTLADIKAGKSLAEIKARWAAPLAEFEARRKKIQITGKLRAAAGRVRHDASCDRSGCRSPWCRARRRG